ncbi:MAG: hypothetical protein IIA07_11905 [Proteobacteria bacterium]|nr:hypothetical protein [Pseudomonadota bacterium]
MTYITNRYVLALLVFLGSAVVLGQSPDSGTPGDQELANARALLQIGRADIIREDLHISEDESTGFWPVYDSYRKEILAVRDRQTEMIAEFVRRNREGVLTDAYAEDLIKDYFEIKGDLLKVQESFLERFRQVLPALKVVRFYQLENKMDAEIDAQLALVIPLAEGM